MKYPKLKLIKNMNVKWWKVLCRNKRKIILAGDIELNPGPENPKKYLKIKLRESKAKLPRAKIGIKLYKVTRKDCQVHIVKMKHIAFASVCITLRSRVRGLLLYGHAVNVILENYHLLLSEISKMSTKTLIYHHHQYSRWITQRISQIS